MTQRPGPVDWARKDRLLCEAYGLVPRQCDELTLPEYSVLWMDAQKGGPPGGRGMSDAEIDAEVERALKMTPEELLLHSKAVRDGR